MMQLPALEMHEGGAEVPGSPSSPGSDPGGGGGGGSRATTPREKPVQVLPCPRCESMNTKFCYYNNYSVTQPRHFCRQCQRYWTAGGTLRNVPVGGGSRKKNRPHHAHRPGEPYLQQQQQRSPGAGAGSSSSSGPFAGPLGYQHQQQQHEILLPGFALQQQQYVAHHPYGLDQLSQLSSGVYASILNKPPPHHDTDANLHAMFGNQAASGPLSSSIHPGGYSYPSFQPEHQTTVKPEFWPVGGSNYQASRFESSPTSPMVPNLGLNHPDRLVPQWDQSDMKPTTTTMRNGSSPLHDSSIEEEGSIPSNGYSKSGYEEGDAVSSMWHNLHDMDNLHLSVKW